MKYILLLYLSTVLTFCNKTEMCLAAKISLQYDGNKSLSDLDFQESLSSEGNKKQNYQSTQVFPKDKIKYKNVKSDSEEIKNDSRDGKHRNIIKMIFDSDSLISQITLHMNFLDNSPNQKRNYFNFEKALDPKEGNNVSFYFPEDKNMLPGDKLKKSDYPGYEEKFIVDPIKVNDDMVVKNLSNEAITLRSYSTIGIPSDNEYDTKLNYLPKHSNMSIRLLNEPKYKEEKYKAKINIFKNDPRIELFKRKKGIHSSKNMHKIKIKKDNDLKYEVKSNNYPEMDMDALTRLELFKKKNKKSEHMLHFPHSSMLLHAVLISSSPSPQELNIYDNNYCKYNNSSNVGQDYGNNLLEQKDLKDRFDDKEHDTIKPKEAYVLNNLNKFKKYKLNNTRFHRLNHKLYPLKSITENILRHNKFPNKNTNEIIILDNGPSLDDNIENLVVQAKLKNNRSHIWHKVSAEVSHSTIVSTFDRKNKHHIPRQKVIQNLKYILSKLGNEEKNKEHKIINNFFPNQENQEEVAKKAFIELDFPNAIGRDYNDIKCGENTIEENSDNDSVDKKNYDIELETYDSILESTATKESTLNDLNYVGIEDTGKEQIKSKDLIDKPNKDKPENIRSGKFHNKSVFKTGKSQVGERNSHKKQSNKCNLHSFEIGSYKNILNYKKDIAKKLSQLHEDLEKYTDSNKISDEKGELMRTRIFLKKGVPLQFKTHIKNYSDEAELFTNPTHITTADDLFLGNKNIKEHFGLKKGKPHISQVLNMKNHRHIYPLTDDTVKVKRHAITDNNYLKAYSRFLRDVNVFKFLYDGNNNTASPN